MFAFTDNKTTHAPGSLRLCLSIVDVKFILASPLSRHSYREFNSVRERTIVEMDTAHDLLCLRTFAK